MFAIFRDVREFVEDSYQALYRTTIAQVAVDIHDNISLADVPGETRRIRNAPLIMQAAFYLDGVHRHTMATHEKHTHDLSFSVTFLPVPGNENGDVVYALVDTDQSVLRNTVADISGVTWWPYWDTAERPSDTTAEDWEARRIIWSEVLGTSAPATRGLTWSLLESDGHDVALWTQPDQRIVDQLPSIKMRSERKAIQQISRAVSSNNPDATTTEICTALNRAIAHDLDNLAQSLEPQLNEITLAGLWHASPDRL